MNYCPLMSYNGGNVSRRCFRSECALAADENGECLVKQALQLYVNQEKTKITEKANAIQHFKTVAKDGKRVPASFIDVGV